MRKSRAALAAEREALETRIRALQAEGDCLVGVRLERSGAAGTASAKAQSTLKYARLRSGKGSSDRAWARACPIAATVGGDRPDVGHLITSRTPSNDRVEASRCHNSLSLWGYEAG